MSADGGGGATTSGTGTVVPEATAAAAAIAARSKKPITAMAAIAGDRLNDKNYTFWHTRVRAALVTYSLDHTIDLSGEPKGTADEQTLVYGFLVQCVSDSHLSLIKDCRTGRDAFKALDDLYKAKTPARIRLLRHDFNQLSKGATESIMAYFARGKALVTDLAAYGETYSEDQLCWALLSGLPDEYSVTVSVFEAVDKELAYAHVLKKLVDTEQRLAVANALPTATPAFFAAGRGPNRLGGNGKSQTYAKGPASGPAASTSSSPGFGGKKNIECRYCHKLGHIKSECRKFARDQQRQNAGSGSNPSGSVVLFAVPTSASSRWVVDSGSIWHITNDLADYVPGSYQPYKPGESTIYWGTGGAQAAGRGTVVLRSADCDGTVTLTDVQYIPGCAAKVFSELRAENSKKLKREATTLPFGRFALRFLSTETGKPVLRATRTSTSHYFIDEACAQPPAVTPPARAETYLAGNATLKPTAELWHRRLNHLGLDNCAKLVNMSTGISVPPTDFTAAKNTTCDVCIAAKLHAFPFESSENRATRPLELLHMDLCGPLPVTALGGARYIATFLDDYSDISIVAPLTAKSAAPNKVKTVINMLENQLNLKLATVRTDRGREYLNKELGSYYGDKGVVHQTSAPYTPEQNGRAERLNRTLLERVRAMLADGHLDQRLWGEAVAWASYIRNRSPSRDTASTPWERFYGTKPDLTHLRVFGCAAYVYMRPDQRNKLDPTAKKGVMVGYEPASKAYRVLLGSGDDQRIVISRHVLFDERAGAVVGGEGKHSPPPPAHVPTLFEVLQLGISMGLQIPSAGVAPDVPPPPPALDAPAPLPPAPPAMDAHDGMHAAAAVVPAVLPLASAAANPLLPVGEPPLPAGAAAGMAPPDAPPLPAGAAAGEASDPESGMAAVQPQPGDSDPGDEESEYHTAADGSGDEVPQPVRRTARATAGKPAERYTYLAIKPTAITEPVTVEQALSLPEANKWRAAMDDEMASLADNGTWELKPLPPGAKAIPCKWVYKIKRDANGDIDRYKARLVVKGFRQVQGVDYNEVFAPVSKHATLRTFLALVAERDLELHHLDVKTAFLNGNLEESIYMVQPPGYHDGDANIVCHLRKALYGLKQAPRAWHMRFKEELEKIGLAASDADPGLYVSKGSTAHAYLLTYVDDVLLASNSKGLLHDIERHLMQAFDIHNLGDAELFLGMELLRNRSARTIKIMQRRLTTDLLAKFGLTEANPRATPLGHTTVFRRATDTDELLDATTYPYAELVGSLMYLSVCTRPDISYAVSTLARFMAKPTMAHWNGAKSVMRYLAGTADYGICFGKTAKSIIAYCDADFAGDIDTRRSTTGYVIVLSGAAVTWASRLQPTVAASTTEAEYMAAASITKEALWLKQLLADMDYHITMFPILCDNQTAITLIKNPISSQRSKHIDVLYHFVRERVARKEIAVSYVSTHNMIADCMTKALPDAKFKACRTGMGMC